MRKVILALMLLFCAQRASANACAAAATGNWNQATTWTSCGGTFPHHSTSDTAAIGSAFVVTVSDAEDVGAGSGTAITETGTGKLALTDGAVLSVYGSMTANKGTSFTCTATSSPAKFQFVVPTATTFSFTYTATGSGTTTFNWSGSSTTNVCTFTASLTGTGMATWDSSTNPPAFAFTTNYAVFSNLGNATTAGFNLEMSGSSSAPSINHTLVDNSGYAEFSASSTTFGWTWSGLDFRRCLDTTNFWCARFDSSATPTTPRLVNNINAAATFTQNLIGVGVLASGVQFGQDKAFGDSANAEGFHGSNVNLFANSAATNFICRLCFTTDSQTGNGNSDMTPADVNQSWQDIVMYAHTQNSHEMGGLGGSTANLIQGAVCDGDGMDWTDTGNCIEDTGPFTVANSLCVNEGGQWNADPATTTAMTWLNNTAFTCNPFEISSGGGASTTAKAFRNQLVVYPGFGPTAAGTFDESGLNNGEATFARQTTFSMDYNAFWMMPGGGDSIKLGGTTLNARVCNSSWTNPCLLPNPGLTGSPTSYLGVPSLVAAIATGTATVGTTATNAACSACFTGSPQAGDYLCDTTQSPQLCAPISVVNSTSQITLVSPGITGLVSGHAMSANFGYQATAGQYYGTTANYGTHDRHINPQFIDPSRNLCQWYNTVSGSSAECAGLLSNQIPLSSGNFFTATAGTTTSSISCSTCSFTNYGLGSYTVVQVYAAGGTTIRGRALVNSGAITATTLGLASTITGLASGDVITFVTAIQAVGYALVASNGWDYGSGASSAPVATTPPAWATAQSALSYIRRGFTPMNSQLKNAANATDCTSSKSYCDIGAVPVYPATAQVIM